MAHKPKRPFRLMVEGTKCAVVGVLAFLAVASGSVQTQGVTAAQDSSSTHGQARLTKLLSKHECSETGFGADVIPGSALVMRDNRVQHVSFDDGWAIYSGDANGTLLAVCRVTI